MRKANGIVAALITLLFLAHALLGSASLHVSTPSTFKVFVLVGVAAIAVHVALSIGTSAQQMNDKERPPSPRKKRHLALKWVTGAVLALVAVVHVVGGMELGGRVTLALLAAAIAVHACVGAKSLLKDVGLSDVWRLPFRICVCILACVAGVAALF